MPFPIPKSVLDGLPSSTADAVGPSHQVGPSGRFNDRAPPIAATIRPTTYTPELADRILDGLADGRMLPDICDEEGMPAPRTVHRWALDDVEGFAARMRQARDIGCHHLVDETIAIADNGRNDWMARRKAKGDIDAIVDHEHVSRSRLRIEGRHWLAAKRMPHVYGPRPEPEAPPAAGDAVVRAVLAETMRVISLTEGRLPKDTKPVRVDETGRWVYDGGERDGEPV